jgi:hypothetical protein
MLERLSDYVGVDEANVLDWLPEQGLGAALNQMVTFGESGALSSEVLGSLVAVEGDLTRSFRAE